MLERVIGSRGEMDEFSVSLKKASTESGGMAAIGVALMADAIYSVSCNRLPTKSGYDWHVSVLGHIPWASQQFEPDPALGLFVAYAFGRTVSQVRGIMPETVHYMVSEKELKGSTPDCFMDLGDQEEDDEEGT